MANPYHFDQATGDENPPIRARMLRDWPQIFFGGPNDREFHDELDDEDIDYDEVAFDGGEIAYAKFQSVQLRRGESVTVVHEGYTKHRVRRSDGREFIVPANIVLMPEGAVEWMALTSTWLDAVRYFNEDEYLVDRSYMDVRTLKGGIFRVFDVSPDEFRDFVQGINLKKFPNQWSNGGWIWDWVFDGTHEWVQIRPDGSGQKPQRRPDPKLRIQREPMWNAYERETRSPDWTQHRARQLKKYHNR